MKSSSTTLRSLCRLPGSALALAALAHFIQPSAQAANGSAYYFDVNGATPGFGSPTGTYTIDAAATTVWTTDGTGSTATVAVPYNSSSNTCWTFGKTAADFNGSTFTIYNGTSHIYIGGITVNSSNASITLTQPVGLWGALCPYLASDQTWTVAAGSTLTDDYNTPNGRGISYNNKALTLAGGGTINFNSYIGYASTTVGITENGDASLVVNLKEQVVPGTPSPFGGGFTLISGKLNIATAVSAANAFASFTSNTRPFAINGGTLDNTVGSAQTLIAGAGGYNLGGNFTFTGTSDLTFNNQPVVLTATPQITVSSHNLTISGVISGSGFGLTKAGTNGTLTLNNTETYTGPTTVNAGVLALGASGALNAASNVGIGAGGTFDVSGLGASATYTLGNSATLTASGTDTSTGAATIKGGASGTVSLGARPINLTITPSVFAGDSTHPALSISQGALALNANAVTITNNSSTALGNGDYRLVQVGNGSNGSITGTAPSGTVTVGGAGVATGGSATIGLDSGNHNLILTVSGVSSGGTLTGTATAEAFTTTYGTASTAQTFAISGSGLTADISVVAPSGFEVSSSGSTYGGIATFTQNGGSASGTVYVRLAATAAVSGTYNSQNIVISSGYIIPVNITTAASGNTVSAAELTVTANADSKTYGSVKTYGSGASAFSITSGSLKNTDAVSTVTLTDTNGGGPATAAAGGTYHLTPSALAFTSGTAANYSITYASGLLAVSQRVLTFTGNKSYDGLATADATTLAFGNNIDGSNLTKSGSVTLSGSNLGAQTITSFAGLTLGGAAAGNYTLSGASGSATVNKQVLAFTGSKPYDGLATAAATALVFNNNHDGANLTMSGSVTLAGANSGWQGITSFAGLTLGGSAAGNYTLTGASGSVWIIPNIYFDINDTTAGYYDTLPAGSYNLLSSGTNGNPTAYWSTDSTGTSATAIYNPTGNPPTSTEGRWTFGHVGDDFAGCTLTLNCEPINAPIRGLAVNSTNANITLSGQANIYQNGAQTWTIAAGSTLTEAIAFELLGMNFGGYPLLLTGGGTLNFATCVGFASGAPSNGKITEDGTGLVVNLKAGGAPHDGFGAGFTLANGTLNFATTASYDAFKDFSLTTKPFALNGGILDNTSGSELTLEVGAGGYSIGGNFTFTGSNNLGLGTAPVALAATHQIEVVANNLTIGGIISGSGCGLTKAGNGTLTLAGANTYDGATTVSNGTLGLAAGTQISPITVHTAAFLAFAPGSTITSTSSLTLDAGSKIKLVDAPVAGTSYTLMTADGGISGTPELDTAIPGYTLVRAGNSLQLNYSAVSGFSSWITGDFANGAKVPADQQGPNDNPTGDGISNLMKYAIAGQDPTVANATISTFTGNTLTFSKRTEASGLTYAIVESTDLGVNIPWTEVSGASYVNDPSTISYTLTPGTPAENFVRLNVTQN